MANVKINLNKCTNTFNIGGILFEFNITRLERTL